MHHADPAAFEFLHVVRGNEKCIQKDSKIKTKKSSVLLPCVLTYYERLVVIWREGRGDLQVEECKLREKRRDVIDEDENVGELSFDDVDMDYR